MASQGIMANQRAAGGGSSGPDISQATATPEKVWAGETFFSGASEEMQTGTLDIPAATATPADVLSGATFFAGDTTEIQAGTLALTGNATAARVLSGYTFYNTDAKTKLTGIYSPISSAKYQSGYVSRAEPSTTLSFGFNVLAFGIMRYDYDDGLSMFARDGSSLESGNSRSVSINGTTVTIGWGSSSGALNGLQHAYLAIGL